MKFGIIHLPLFLLTALLTVCCSRNLESYVDPFIGTGMHGHTYPGASRPFGMVQLSPETRTSGWDACAGYHYEDSTIYGFSHTHLSGTGCSDLKDVLFYPSYDIEFRGDTLCGYKPYGFSHKKEKAGCGYYSVELDCGIKVELTAGKRIGVHRYRFDGKKAGRILVDLSFSAEDAVVRDSYVQIVSDNELSGMRCTNGWVSDRKVYFYVRFSDKFKTSEIVGNKFALLSFGKETGTIVAGVGISSVSCENARKNLEEEACNLQFDEVREKALDEWKQIFSRFNIHGGTQKDKRIFYTSLYHVFLAPSLMCDVNGQYMTHSQSISLADASSYYSTISLWDTFRTWFPLMTIIDRNMVEKIIVSMLDMYLHTGELPIWPLWSGETFTMIGYHAAAVISDAYLKGIRGYDAELALEAMIRSSEINRKGSDYYMKYGYVPYDKISESVSLTLEYAYDDWAIARMAEAMGKNDIAEKYYARSDNYKNVFDKSILFFRPRHSNGSFKDDFRQSATSDDYTEATPWNYRFFVPHDTKGLIEMYGSERRFEDAIDSLFLCQCDESEILIEDVTGLMGHYAHGNEPGHHNPYLYNYTDSPYKTQGFTGRILKEMYDDTPSGIAGNEDCGQMSAWYVMTSVGLYPACPASNEFLLTKPLFRRVKILLSGGKRLIIRAKGSGKYIAGVRLDGVEIKRNHIYYEEIINGGELEFFLTDDIKKACRNILEKPYSKTK